MSCCCLWGSLLSHLLTWILLKTTGRAPHSCPAVRRPPASFGPRRLLCIPRAGGRCLPGGHLQGHLHSPPGGHFQVAATCTPSRCGGWTLACPARGWQTCAGTGHAVCAGTFAGCDVSPARILLCRSNSPTSTTKHPRRGPCQKSANVSHGDGRRPTGDQGTVGSGLQGPRLPKARWPECSAGGAALPRLMLPRSESGVCLRLLLGSGTCVIYLLRGPVVLLTLKY